MMVLVLMGSFGVANGAGHPYRSRAKILALIGILMVLAGICGNWLGHWVKLNGALPWYAGPDAAWSHLDLFIVAMLPLAFISALAGILVFIALALKMPPPGMFFPLVTLSAAMATAQAGVSPTEIAIASSCGALSAWIIGMGGVLFQPMGPVIRAVQAAETELYNYEHSVGTSYQKQAINNLMRTSAEAWIALAEARAIRGGKIIRPEYTDLVKRTMAVQARWAEVTSPQDNEGLSRSGRIPIAQPTAFYRLKTAFGITHEMATAIRVAVACGISAALSVFLGLGRPDWAIISVIVVLQLGLDRVPGTIRALQRLLGSIVGVFIFALLHWFEPGPILVLLLLTVFLFLGELFVVSNYGITIMLVTPMALLLGATPNLMAGHLIWMRVLEITLAVAVSIASLWLVLPYAELKITPATRARCRAAARRLSQDLRHRGAGDCLKSRSQLRWQIRIDSLAAMSAVRQWPGARGQQEWHLHVQNHAVCERLLMACVSRPGMVEKEFLDAVDAELDLLEKTGV